MKNFKLIVEYDGTNYHGWQSQPGSGKPTIQDTLEQALQTLTREKVKVYSSGRTDAGVHALGHGANFKTTSSIPAEAWAPALNQVLPPDIRVLTSAEVADDFHARYSAQSKVYTYRILNRREPTALYGKYSWHVNRRLNVKNMKLAAEVLLGKHDFSAFRGSGCTAKNPVKTVTSLTVKRSGSFVEIAIEADAFLQYMVRNIVGTLVEVGLGRFQPEEMRAILMSCDRTRAGRTAPPQGLYLTSVQYP